MGFEITVKVNDSYDNLINNLKRFNFLKEEEFVLDDTYYIKDDLDINNMSNLELLKQMIIVRKFKGEISLIKKVKEYDDKGDILNEKSYTTIVNSKDDTDEFLKAIEYKEVFKIFAKCSVYINDITELLVQYVNDKYILIEIEDNCSRIHRIYNSLEEIKEDLNKYKLNQDTSNYFVKKAEIEIDNIIRSKR